MSGKNIESSLKEVRVFPPSAEFSSRATVSGMDDYEKMYRQSIDEPDAFWSGVASELEWFEPWSKVLEWDEPFSEWFVGAKTNLSYNCLDRHLSGWRKNRVRFALGGRAG